MPFYLDPRWLTVGAIAILGLVVGSFLNVVIYRVPRHESVIKPRSHCPTCMSPLRPWHAIPLLSWLILGGHCARCKAPISLRYPLVEAVTAVLFGALTWRFGLTVQLPAYLYFAAVGVALAVIDLDVRKLPDSILLPSYIVSALMLMPAGAADGDWRTGGRALAGMAALAAIFFALAVAFPHAMDFANVKLAGLVGLYLGWMSWAAVLVGAFGSILLVVLGAKKVKVRRRDGRGLTVLLAPSMILAAHVAVFATVPLTTWYSSLLGVA